MAVVGETQAAGHGYKLTITQFWCGLSLPAQELQSGLDQLHSRAALSGGQRIIDQAVTNGECHVSFMLFYGM